MNFFDVIQHNTFAYCYTESDYVTFQRLKDDNRRTVLFAIQWNNNYTGYEKTSWTG